MEQTVAFEQKVYLTPKYMNRMAQESIDDRKSWGKKSLSKAKSKHVSVKNAKVKTVRSGKKTGVGPKKKKATPKKKAILKKKG